MELGEGESDLEASLASALAGPHRDIDNYDHEDDNDNEDNEDEDGEEDDNVDVRYVWPEFGRASSPRARGSPRSTSSS
ncbi:hypothetical protein GSI_08713 [Ganoderma sinense ZZ0214-1]|uniref:Uncharacterized protein n=1 Tax=Ganoderma sinense ZZ0214-1 TaxID=1077348 RepID=A0A2G8S4G0_9APHY|nr:hypothetical protein GSI_08713 [Ganoderma sinense ZZ0214-1]